MKSGIQTVDELLLSTRPECHFPAAPEKKGNVSSSLNLFSALP